MAKRRKRKFGQEIACKIIGQNSAQHFVRGLDAGKGQEQGLSVYYRQYRALRVRMDVDSGKAVPITRCSCLVLPAVIVGDAVFKGEYIDVVDLPLCGRANFLEPAFSFCSLKGLIW